MISTRRLIPIASGYLLGGISTGYYLVKWRTGMDIRTSGSGSSGARNVSRSLGKRGFIVTAAGDMAKGAAIPALARQRHVSHADVGLVSVAAVAGHVWPVQMGFRGGRGLTVAFGAVMVTEPRVGISALAIAGVLLPWIRNFTPAGLIGTALAPFIAALFRLPASSIRSIAGMATIVLFGHRHYIWKGFDSPGVEDGAT